MFTKSTKLVHGQELDVYLGLTAVLEKFGFILDATVGCQAPNSSMWELSIYERLSYKEKY